jgi:hypothetical protein
MRFARAALMPLIDEENGAATGAASAGLVPGSISTGHAVFPADPTVHRLVVLAWNATSNPPPGSAAIAGLVPGSIPNCQSAFPPGAEVHRLVVLAWKATSNPPSGHAGSADPPHVNVATRTRSGSLIMNEALTVIATTTPTSRLRQ